MRDRRTITLGVRVSPEERAAIERAAAREYRRLSDFVRAAVLKTVEGQRDGDQKQTPAAWLLAGAAAGADQQPQTSGGGLTWSYIMMKYPLNRRQR